MLLGLELSRMHATPASPHFHRMLQVQHLVVDDVLNHKSGNSRMIEYAADDNSIVRGVIVAEAIAGPVAAPTHLWTRQQAMKKLNIEFLKDRLQIVDETLR